MNFFYSTVAIEDSLDREAFAEDVSFAALQILLKENRHVAFNTY
jgi:hypothetical protein